MSNIECLNSNYAYIVVEYENGIVKNKYQFSTKNLAKTFVKTMGKDFRYKGQKKK
ncbi:MAG: hypothetical protein Q4A21_02220 [bacterium]|nr:hypothetical protein [bacterium]